jgi:anti-sigma regulatory factor (Ser/Thr protein kinase)
MARTQTRLPSNIWAPASARQLVRQMCPLWQVDDDLQEIAQVVVSELVDITLGPANTAAARLILERGPRGLRVAIRNASPSGPRRREERSTNPPRQGLGLQMLGNLTTAWGVDIQPDGKTAWAEITK